MIRISIPSLSGFFVATSVLLASCSQVELSPAVTIAPKAVTVIAYDSLLLDIAKNVAGDRLKVETLIPIGIDPHSFEPVPADIQKLSSAQAILINGAGLEAHLDDILSSLEPSHKIIVASEGLNPRSIEQTDEHGGEIDPHFWFDPNLTIRYVENIRDGFSSLDPEGEDLYARNASAYINQLAELDRWIREQTNQIPPEQRKLITNHESFGYFADRYGFELIGTVLPSVSPGTSPSAMQLTELIKQIKSSNAKAIFLETGSDRRLADQIAAETGVQVVSTLFTHSLSAADGPAGTYLDLIRHDVNVICSSLR